MIRCFSLVLLVLTSCGSLATAGENSLTYYVQVIRGTDENPPADLQVKEIGPKLRNRLSPVFRWKNYWEIKRTTITVERGKAALIHLPSDRALEVAWVTPAESEFRIYSAGKLLRRSRQLIETKMAIMGGDNSGSDCWFVVVRRDPPR